MKPTNDVNILPSPDTLNQFEHGRFVLSNLAAKRAKQLKDGAPPLVSIESNHPLTIALAEIASGKIYPNFVPLEAIAPAESMEAAALEEGEITSKLGILLPSLDEVEADLKTLPLLHDEEEELHEEETSEESLQSIGDLLEEDVEIHEPTAEEEEGEKKMLSLSEIEEGESVAEEDEEE